MKAQGKAKIDEALCSDTLGFVGCYLLLFIAGTLSLVTLLLSYKTKSSPVVGCVAEDRWGPLCVIQALL